MDDELSQPVEDELLQVPGDMVGARYGGRGRKRHLFHSWGRFHYFSYPVVRRERFGAMGIHIPY